MEMKKKSSDKTLETVAKEVILGKWGNGDELRKKLAEAGYDYEKIHQKVIELL